MKSMTGFAKTQFEIENRTYSVEIKTLNSKQLDINTKLPILFRDRDLEIRSLLNVLTRGKVEFIIVEDTDKSKNVSKLNFDVAQTHYNECLKLQQMLDTKADNLLSVVLSQSDVWEIAETKEISDEVCKEYGKSVLENAEFYNGDRNAYWVHKHGGKTRRDILREDVDDAINNSASYVEFVALMKHKGYAFSRSEATDHPSVKAPTWEKAIRFDRLGNEYSPIPESWPTSFWRLD